MSNIQTFVKSMGQLKCAVSSHSIDPKAVEKLCEGVSQSVETHCMRCMCPLTLRIDESDPDKYEVIEN